jgi:hypothetical protein
MPLEDFSARIDPPPIEQFKWGLSMVDAATVPSVRLVDDWSQYTNVYKVLDYINTYHYPTLDKNHGNEIWIGLGNRIGYDSFEKSNLLAAMENVCRKCPQVKLVLSSIDENSMALNINSAQLKVYSPCSFEDWVGILLSLDIGLMPIYGDYDLRFGSYDLLEFMISKISWIASKEPTFYKLSLYGQWVQNSKSAWENAILNMVDQLEARQRQAVRDPFLFALSQDLSANIDKILKVYATILDR